MKISQRILDRFGAGAMSIKGDPYSQRAIVIQIIGVLHQFDLRGEVVGFPSLIMLAYNLTNSIQFVFPAYVP